MVGPVGNGTPRALDAASHCGAVQVHRGATMCLRRGRCVSRWCDSDRGHRRRSRLGRGRGRRGQGDRGRWGCWWSCGRWDGWRGRGWWGRGRWGRGRWGRGWWGRDSRRNRDRGRRRHSLSDRGRGLGNHHDDRGRCARDGRRRFQWRHSVDRRRRNSRRGRRIRPVANGDNGSCSSSRCCHHAGDDSNGCATREASSECEHGRRRRRDGVDVERTESLLEPINEPGLGFDRLISCSSAQRTGQGASGFGHVRTAAGDSFIARRSARRARCSVTARAAFEQPSAAAASSAERSPR